MLRNNSDGKVKTIPFDPARGATVIAFGSPKGGCGKTTLTVAFANELSRRCEGPIRVADVDYNANAYIHMSEALKQDGAPQIETRHLHALVSNPKLLSKSLKDMADGAQFLLLDTPGAIEDLGAQICLTAADIVIVPIKPAGYDLDATRKGISALSKIGALNPDQVQMMALNMPSETNVGQHITKLILEEFGGRSDIHLLKTAVREAVAFQESRAAGLPIWMLGRNGRNPMQDIPAIVTEMLETYAEVVNG